jgi:hypothetical protein
MRRAGIVVLAALLLTGCGGSDDGGKTAKTPDATPTLAPLTTAQACAQVQMVNDELDGPGRWPIPTYGKFGAETAPIADEADHEISDALKSMSDQATTIGGMTGDDDLTSATSEWATRYQAVADICARTDKPIARLP